MARKVAVPVNEVSDDPRTDDELVDLAEGNLQELEQAAGEEQTVEIDMDLVGLDMGSTGRYELVTTPQGFGPKDRTLRIGNVTVEHVDEDQYGRWLYRPLD